MQVLSAPQIAAIQNIQKSNWYRVQVLNREVEGISQTVILVGETHVKSARAAKLGEEMLNTFSDIGVEGVDGKKYIGNSFLKGSIKFIHSMAKVFSLGYLRGGSTIYKANSLNDKNSISLEKDHKPSWNDQLLSLGVQSCSLLIGAEILGSLYRCTFGDSEAAHYTMIGLRSVLGGTATVGIFLPFFTHTRDQAMADSIQSYFEDRKNKVLLVVTGMLHTHKISRLLQESVIPWRRQSV